MPNGRKIFDKARLENFSDGVFAILITVLVLGFQIPIHFRS